MRCIWKLARKQFGIVLEFFRRDANGIWLRHKLELSKDLFDDMELEVGQDRIWNWLRIISMRCN